MPTASPRWQHQ